MRFVFYISMCLFLVFGTASANEAEKTVNSYHIHLMATLSDPDIVSDQSRYDALAPAMDEAFDFKTMTKTITGRTWAKTDEATQTKLIAAFRDVSIAIYADQFAGLEQGEFKVLGSRDGPRGLKLIDTTLKTPNEDVTLIYVLRFKEAKWRIIDVLLDGGISELALRASEYSGILKKSGPNGLINSLHNQTKTLLTN